MPSQSGAPHRILYMFIKYPGHKHITQGTSAYPELIAAQSSQFSHPYCATIICAATWILLLTRSAVLTTLSSNAPALWQVTVLHLTLQNACISDLKDALLVLPLYKIDKPVMLSDGTSLTHLMACGSSTGTGRPPCTVHTCHNL
jgi:hypothetical protein